MKNYILYTDGSKEPVVNYSIIDGHLCGVYAPSGYYTFNEVIERHPESGLSYMVPIFERHERFERNGFEETVYIRVNNIKEIVIEFPNKETL